MAFEKTAALFRLPEELRLLQQAETITDFPAKLIKSIQVQIEELNRNIVSCKKFLKSPPNDATPEQIEAHQNKLDLYSVDLLQIFRVLKAYECERQRALDRQCVQAHGQFESFSEQMLEKLSPSEKKYLKAVCHRLWIKNEQLNQETALERNGKHSSFADVYFERDCVIQDPWRYSTTGDISSNLPLRLYQHASISRLPLHRAQQLASKSLVTIIQVYHNQWVEPRVF